MSQSWADDPELIATFRAEVEERVASLTAGLLQLETHPSPQKVVAGMFRDAHTVKGSARMMGLDGVLQLAHRCEDLLGAVRDQRLSVNREIIDLLLAACDGIGSALPGVDRLVPAEHLDSLMDALDRALAGEAVVVPLSPERAVETSDDAAELTGDVDKSRADSVRVATGKVYDLLDVVGEAELDARRAA
jgi:chemotaxis protein histidine kinase CheA